MVADVRAQLRTGEYVGGVSKDGGTAGELLGNHHPHGDQQREAQLFPGEQLSIGPTACLQSANQSTNQLTN